MERPSTSTEAVPETTRRPRLSPAGRRSVRTRVVCAVGRGSAVRLRIEVDVPCSGERLWRVVSDLPTFLCVDPYHRRVIPLRRPLEPGVHLAIEHGLAGIRFMRFGRLLAWREGRGYAFSDLSARGSHRGFPHVFVLELVPLRPPGGGNDRDPLPLSRLRIEVRGRWTARRVPVFLRRAWLVATCRLHASLLKRHFEALDLADV